MRKLLVVAATVISAVVVSASPISVKWCAQGVFVSQDARHGARRGWTTSLGRKRGGCSSKT